MDTAGPHLSERPAVEWAASQIWSPAQTRVTFFQQEAELVFRMGFIWSVVETLLKSSLVVGSFLLIGKCDSELPVCWVQTGFIL